MLRELLITIYLCSFRCYSSSRSILRLSRVKLQVGIVLEFIGTGRPKEASMQFLGAWHTSDTRVVSPSVRSRFGGLRGAGGFCAPGRKPVAAGKIDSRRSRQRGNGTTPPSSSLGKSCGSDTPALLARYYCSMMVRTGSTVKSAPHPRDCGDRLFAPRKPASTPSSRAASRAAYPSSVA